MTTLGWAGVGLLVVAGLTIVVEGVMAAWWARAVAQRVLTLSQRLETQRRMLEADLEKLRLAMEETKRLWRPYGIVLRWLQHPLVVALLASYRRRWMLR